MKHTSVLLSIAVAGMIVISACAAPAEAPVTAEPASTESAAPEAPTEAAADALFKIVKTDGSSFDVTLESVKTLPLSSITVEGKVQEGPKLADVLALAGVTEFTEVTLSGSSAATTLTADQVDDNTILDFSNRGTMKLATTYIPKAAWTKDITEISVK
jgi:hypothetical protein